MSRHDVRSVPAAREVRRQAWMDNLRIALISGVIVAHAATAYVVDVGWYYEERTGSELASTLITGPVFIGAIYGLGPLFVMAGWLSATSLERRGAADFVRARLLRLGVPLLLFGLVVDPLADWIGGTAQGESRGLLSYLGDPGGDRDVGPMWFVAAILVFSLIYTAVRARRPAPEEGGTLTTRVLVLLSLAVVVADFVTWQLWGYLSETLSGLNWAHWPQGAALFVLGVLAGERGWLRDIPRRIVRQAAWASVGAVGLLTMLAGYVVANDELDLMTYGFHWQSALFAVADGFGAIALCVWLIAWFERRWNAEPGPVVAAAGRGSYAAYVLHPVPMVLLSWLLAAVAIPVEVKFVLVAVAAVPLCFAVGYGVTRIPGVSRVL